MAYLGNTPTQQAFTPAIDTFSGNGSTVAFTLSRPVASVAQVQVVIANVPQDPNSAYTVSSNTITFTSAPLSGTNNIYVYYTSPITQVITPGQGTVTSDSFGVITNFTTTGNTTLGDATTDTLTVGVTGIVKDSSGNVGIGTASPTVKFQVGTYLNAGAAGTAFISGPNIAVTNTAGMLTVGATDSIAANIGGSIGFTANGTTAGYPTGAIAGRRENATAGDYASYLQFSTCVAGGTVAEKMRIDSSGNVGIGTTSPNAKLQVSSSTDFGAVLKVSDTSSESTGFVVLGNGNSTDKAVGIWRGAANSVSSSGTFLNLGGYGGMAFSTGAALLGSQTERMRITSAGDVGIGTTVPGSYARLAVFGNGASSAAYAFATFSNVATSLTSVRNDGYFSTGLAGASPYNATIGTAANLVVYSGDGGLYRSVSSIKYKKDVVDYTKGLDAVASLRPVFYKGISPVEGDTVYAGLIAEEVHDAGLTEFVQYAQDGTPDALSYGNMVALAFKAIQEQQALILSLTDRLTALENR